MIALSVPVFAILVKFGVLLLPSGGLIALWRKNEKPPLQSQPPDQET